LKDIELRKDTIAWGEGGCDYWIVGDKVKDLSWDGDIMMELKSILLIGFIGSVLMFFGDMALYYDRNDY